MVLRAGFGLLWVFDGILQAQPAMAAGLPGKVVAPAAATAPIWVRHLIDWSGTAWTFHPVQEGAATVWIQVGIGVWLLAAARGRWSRLAGLASAGWGLLVWVFGEVFGGLFLPGQSLLTGTPGAVAFYCVAGGLIALPDRSWRSAVLGRRLIAGLGIFFAAMAVLQAWPGRGFWQGSTSGPLVDMLTSMSANPQPVPLAHLVADFASLTARHGFAINMIAVATLGTIAVGLLGARRRALLAVIVVLVSFCLADWVLVQDLGFLGGLGTDPNSMIPLLLLAVCGYLGVSRVSPVAATSAAPVAASAEPDQPAPAARGWRWRDQSRRLACGLATTSATGLLALWAAVVLLIGAAPMAMAQANPVADPIIAQALDGVSTPLDIPAQPFTLHDISGKQVSLHSLRGKVLLLTFLDPASTTGSPLIAQELREADHLLGPRAASVTLVAITANPLRRTGPDLRAFDRQEGLAGLSGWLFLTGSLPELRQVWTAYGISPATLPSGQPAAPNDFVFVIDRSGHLRTKLHASPGTGTPSSVSSFAAEFAQAATQALAAHP